MASMDDIRRFGSTSEEALKAAAEMSAAIRRNEDLDAVSRAIEAGVDPVDALADLNDEGERRG